MKCEKYGMAAAVPYFFKNFPMAFFWNMFAAAPFSHWLFAKLVPQEK